MQHFAQFMDTSMLKQSDSLFDLSFDQMTRRSTAAITDRQITSELSLRKQRANYLDSCTHEYT